MRKLAILLTLVVTSSATAQIPMGPDLRLWLKADDLSTAGLNDGDHLTEWIDASQYSTRFAPRVEFNPSGPFGFFDLEEAPTMRMVDIAGDGNLHPTVRFDRSGPIFGTDPACPTPSDCAGDPAVPGSGSTDRLYQTNNLGGAGVDPTHIADGTDMTAIAVFKPDLTTSPGLGYQTIFGKRGTNESLYTLGVSFTGANTGRFNHVQYDANTEYFSGHFPQEDIWHVAGFTVEDDPMNPGTPEDLIDFLDDESGDPNMRMVSQGAMPSVMQNRNPGTNMTEPLGIGAHSQSCCGEGETFAGNIAEIIIYARKLDATDLETVEAYLNDKYFASADPPLDCDFDGDEACDGTDINMLTAEIAAGTNDLSFDLTGDNMVNLDDRDAWLASAGEENLGPGLVYLVGDATLDGNVDGQDFVRWNDNKFTPITDWTGGNFNADSDTNGQDFVLWNENKFMSSDGVSPVPEPGAAWLILVALAASGLRRRS